MRRDVSIPAAGVALPGTLAVPPGAGGIVVFAHGSGSSRRSPRNRFVADVLCDAGLATLLFDLLTPAEELDRANVFDIPLLAARLRDAAAWLEADDALRPLRVGYFGASTGAAAALWAAAGDRRVTAVVSRGGRPDLAGPRLGDVRAATLLVVGGADTEVLALNEAARAQLHCTSELRVVPGAGHLFEEPGALHEVAVLARDWFLRYLVEPPTGAGSAVSAPESVTSAPYVASR